MKRGQFMDIISVHYKDIRKLFVSRSSNQGYQFSDDAFNDAFISCALHFGNKTIDYDCAVKYFWVTYRNAIHCEHSKTEKTILQDEFEDIVDETYDSGFAEYIYDTVMNAIVDSFGEEDMQIYSLYKYHGWTQQDLIDSGYDCKNLEIRIKNIHRFVKQFIKLKYKNT